MSNESMVKQSIKKKDGPSFELADGVSVVVVEVVVDVVVVTQVLPVLVLQLSVVQQ